MAIPRINIADDIGAGHARARLAMFLSDDIVATDGSGDTVVATQMLAAANYDNDGEVTLSEIPVTSYELLNRKAYIQVVRYVDGTSRAWSIDTDGDDGQTYNLSSFPELIGPSTHYGIGAVDIDPPLTGGILRDRLTLQLLEGVMDSGTQGNWLTVDAWGRVSNLENRPVPTQTEFDDLEELVNTFTAPGGAVSDMQDAIDDLEALTTTHTTTLTSLDTRLDLVESNARDPLAYLTRVANSAEISSIDGDGSVVVVTTVTNHNFVNGDWIAVSGTTAYNVAEAGPVLRVSDTVFSYPSAINAAAEGEGFVSTKRLFLDTVSPFELGVPITVTNDQGAFHLTTVTALGANYVALAVPIPVGWIDDAKASVNAIVTWEPPTTYLARGAHTDIAARLDDADLHLGIGTLAVEAAPGDTTITLYGKHTVIPGQTWVVIEAGTGDAEFREVTAVDVTGKILTVAALAGQAPPLDENGDWLLDEDDNPVPADPHPIGSQVRILSQPTVVDSWFGLVGDYSTPFTIRANRILEGMGSVGGKIVLTTGTYMVEKDPGNDARYLIQSAQHVTWVGIGRVIIKAETLTANGKVTLMAGGAYRNWRFENIEFDSNDRVNKSYVSGAYYNITSMLGLTGSYNVVFFRCTLRDSAIGLNGAGLDSVKLKECFISGVGTGVMTGGTWDPTPVPKAELGAGFFFGANSRRIQIEDCVFHMCEGGIQYNPTASSQTAHDARIVNNYFRGGWNYCPYFTGKWPVVSMAIPGSPFAEGGISIVVTAGGFTVSTTTGYFPSSTNPDLRTSIAIRVPQANNDGSAGATIDASVWSARGEIKLIIPVKDDVADPDISIRAGDILEFSNGKRAIIRSLPAGITQPTTTVQGSVTLYLEGWQAIDTFEPTSPVGGTTMAWRIVRIYGALVRGATGANGINTYTEPVDVFSGRRILSDDLVDPAVTPCEMVAFPYMNYQGVHISGALQDLVVERNYTAYVRSDTLSITNAPRVRVTGNTIFASQDMGITVGACPGAVVSDNVGTGIGASFIFSQGNGIIVNGNHAFGWGYTNWHLASVVYHHTGKSSIISNNTGDRSGGVAGGGAKHLVHLGEGDYEGTLVHGNVGRNLRAEELLLDYDYPGSGPTATAWVRIRDVLTIAYLQDATEAIIEAEVRLSPLHTKASSAIAAGLRLPPGVAPTTPVSGDIWHASNRLAMQAGDMTLRYPAGPYLATANPVVTNTSSETTILPVAAGGATNTFPAGWLNIAGKLVEVELAGRANSHSAPGTWTFRVKLGSTNILVSAAVTPQASMVDWGIRLWALLRVLTTGAAANVLGEGFVQFSNSGVLDGPLHLALVPSAAVPVDLTAEQLLDVTVQMSVANAANKIDLVNPRITVHV